MVTDPEADAVARDRAGRRPNQGGPQVQRAEGDQRPGAEHQRRARHQHAHQHQGFKHGSGEHERAARGGVLPDPGHKGMEKRLVTQGIHGRAVALTQIKKQGRVDAGTLPPMT